MIAIVNQLCNANESEGGLPIVILSEQEKVRLHDCPANVRAPRRDLSLNRLFQRTASVSSLLTGVDGGGAGQARHQSAGQPHHLQVIYILRHA